MVGVLILIPVLILLIVAAVSNILSLAAWIAVDDMRLTYKNGETAESISVVFPSDKDVYDFYDYIKVEIEPKRANRYSIEWKISGKVDCMDEEYEKKYQYYLDHIDDPNVPEVKPPAMLVDAKGNEVESNTTGKFAINSYCRFNVVVRAENVTKTLAVTVEGYDVNGITIVNVTNSESNALKVGETIRLDAKYNPVSSIVTEARWHSSNPEIASVDANGIVKGHKAGTATITVEANKHTDPSVFVTSVEYAVEVLENVSRFGADIKTSKTVFTLDKDLGIDKDDVISYDGCIVDGNRVTVNSGVATIETSKGTLKINACSDNAISIANSEMFEAAGGYVFAVSDLTLKLGAVWTDDLKEGLPEGVKWTSSNASVATVDNGEVKAVSSGLVRITAEKDGQTASVILNVQIKVISMQLRTSNESFAVGIARETVFAAEKYADIARNADRTANSLNIEIVGAPVRGENENLQEFNIREEVFYAAYTFEIESGKEYAVMGGEYGNTLIFVPDALKGKGRQTVRVKVRAKYPKYESTDRFTQSTVDVNVIYGVEVNSIEELRQASQDQKDFAYSEDNLIAESLFWEHINTSGGRNDRYRVYNGKRSHSTYSIVFGSDIAFELDENGKPVTIGYEQSIYIYGNVYGNNKKLYAASYQMTSYAPMMYVVWSDITISNLILRANDIADNGNITTDETSGFRGQCIYVKNEDDGEKFRLTNILVEYCILENAKRAVEVINCDVKLVGNIVRNLSNVALFGPTRVNIKAEDDGIFTSFPQFLNLDIANCVFSECLASVGYFPYECYTYMPKTSANPDASFNDYKDTDVSDGVGRFVRGDLQANERYFKEHFLSAGINSSVKQRGFFDIYNWQNLDNANLIGDLGDPALNQVIQAASGSLLKENETFAPALYIDESENKSYFHMGFLTSGIYFPQGIFSAPSYLEVSLEDSRFTTPIRTKGMPIRSSDFMGKTAERFLTNCDCIYYSYTTDADIKPNSKYEVNDKLISDLHGER